MEQKQHTLSRLGLTAALLLVAVLLALGGSAYARYRTVQERYLDFSTAAELVPTVTDTLSVNGSVWTDTITLENRSNVKLEFTPRTMVSLGIGAANHAVVTLTADNGQTVYTGNGTTIAEGSFLYDSFGPGWYYWYPYGSQELVLALESGNTMTVIVTISLADAQGTPVSFPAESKVQTEFVIQH